MPVFNTLQKLVCTLLSRIWIASTVHLLLNKVVQIYYMCYKSYWITAEWWCMRKEGGRLILHFFLTCVPADTRAYTYAIDHSYLCWKSHGFSSALQKKWTNTHAIFRLSSFPHEAKNKWWIIALDMAVDTFVALILNSFLLKNQNKRSGLL